MDSGGNASSEEIFGSCHYYGELYMISVIDSASLMELFLSLSTKCSEIKPETVLLQYVAPHEKMYVTLNDDDGVSNMIKLYMRFKLTIIEMRGLRRSDQMRSNRYVERLASEDEIYCANYSNIELILFANSMESWRNCVRGEGQNFKDANEFRICLKNYAVARRRSFLFKKNDCRKVIAVCSEKNCEWRVYASRHKADNLFAIRTCNLNHSCGEDNLRSRGHPRADGAWVANIVKDKLRGEPLYRPSTMIKDILRDYGIELQYHRAWMGKELAMHDIHGTDSGSYDRLRWYCRVVVQTNPGSVVDCEVDHETNKFQRLFICLNACVVGFVSGCRPLLFLDGTHIKNKYRGSILVAMSKDGNDDMFSVTYAVVDAENDDNWMWFCLKLRSVLLSQHVTMFDQYTFFSDRHPGIIKAIEVMFPNSHHAYCLRHLVDNFVKQVMRKYPIHNKKRWTSVFNKAAYALTVREFDEHYQSIIKSMPIAEGFIRGSKPRCWANALFPGERWGVMNNNIAESWNNWVKHARSLPIVAMVDHIRIQIMKMLHQRRETSIGWTSKLTPEQEKKLLPTYNKSRSLIVNRSTSWTFEVVDGDKKCDVDLQLQKCSCKVWQMYKLPCEHACAAIESKSMSIYDFCDRYYKTEMYQQAYRDIINPIPTTDMQLDEVDDEHGIHAPDVHCQPGRRRTKRIPSQTNVRLLTCGRCHRSGHNRRTCKEGV